MKTAIALNSQVDEVPLLTSVELALLTQISLGPVSLLDCSFADAVTLKVADLIQVFPATNFLVLTPAGRRFLSAGP